MHYALAWSPMMFAEPWSNHVSARKIVSGACAAHKRLPRRYILVTRAAGRLLRDVGVRGSGQVEGVKDKS